MTGRVFTLLFPILGSLELFCLYTMLFDSYRHRYRVYVGPTARLIFLLEFICHDSVIKGVHQIPALGTEWDTGDTYSHLSSLTVHIDS